MMASAFRPILYETVVALLIEARETAGISAKDLAARFSLGEGFVTSYERGDRQLDVGEFVAVCRSLGTDPYDILRLAEGVEGRF